MNFDELQSAWNSDSGNDIHVPASIEKLKRAVTPVNIIKKNMRKELIVQSIAIFIIAFIPTIGMTANLILPFYILYAIMVCIAVAFFIRFKLFYKHLNTNTLSSKENLYEVYYDLKLNIEIYRSFNYAILPFILIFTIMMLVSMFDHHTLFKSGKISQQKIFWLFSFFIFTMIITVWTVEVWIKHYYGKHLTPIRKLLDELE